MSVKDKEYRELHAENVPTAGKSSSRKLIAVQNSAVPKTTSGVTNSQ